MQSQLILYKGCTYIPPSGVDLPPQECLYHPPSYLYRKWQKLLTHFLAFLQEIERFSQNFHLFLMNFLVPILLVRLSLDLAARAICFICWY